MKQTNHSHLIQLSKATPVKKPRGTRGQQGTVPVASETDPSRRRSIKPSEFRRFYDRGDLPIQAAALWRGFFGGQKKGSWN